MCRTVKILAITLLFMCGFAMMGHSVEHKVTFFDYDSVTIVSTQQVEEGGDAVLPDDPTRTGYQFVRWDGVYQNITQDTSLYAVYEKERYTVQFLDFDSTLISQKEVAFGDEVTPPTAPENECHPFKSWNSDFSGIVSDTAFLVVRDTNRYTVIFYDYDGTTLLKEEQIVECGASAIAPDSPTRLGHIFSKWSGNYTEITHDTAFYAVYEKERYIVQFLDFDSTLISQKEMAFGDEVTPPTAPENECHPFKSWNSDFSGIVSDTAFLVVRDTNHYSVIFYDSDSTILKEEQIVDCGSSAVAPENPTRLGHIFSKWSGNYTEITHDTAFYAVYEKERYTVQFLDFDSTLISQKEVAFGDEVTPPIAPENECYPFRSWNSDFSDIVSDTAFLAVRDTNRYSVIFYDYDGTTLLKEEQIVECGASAIAPDSPTRVGYTFTGWNYKINNVRENLVVKAQYAINKYRVTLTCEHGTAFGAGDYIYNKEVTIIAKPGEHSSFVRWSDGDENATRKIVVTGDISLTAICVLDTFEIAVAGEHCTTYGSGIYDYGEECFIYAESEEGYQFSHWSDGDTTNYRTFMVTKELNLTAICTPRSYKVVMEMPYSTIVAYHQVEDEFVPMDSTEKFYYDETYRFEAVPRIGYYFVGWDNISTENPLQLTITQDTLLRVLCEPYSYTITTHDTDSGIVTGGAQYYFGEVAKIEAFPNEHYQFLKWNDEYAANPRLIYVSQDMDLTPIFVLETHTITATAVYGTLVGDGAYEYGAEATLEVLPLAHCHFEGWSDGNTDNPRKVIVTSDTTFSAICAYNKHTLTVDFDAEKGSVEGAGVYDYGTQVAVKATAKEGYYFSHWADGRKVNPVYITVLSDTLIQAVFNKTIIIDDQEFEDSVAVVATDTMAIFMWPSNPNAQSYSLMYWYGNATGIKLLTFDKYGNLVGTTPETPVEVSVIYYSLTGLRSNTLYEYVWQSKAADGTTIKQINGTFKTLPSSTAVENVFDDAQPRIYARNGRVYGSERMRIYTTTGLDVTSQNGHLDGVYIVVIDQYATKIIVH